MILTLTRDNTATKGLIVAQTDETTLQALKLYKPTELQSLDITDLDDAQIQIAMTIGQRNYTVKSTELVINGVDQSLETSTQISDTLSALFLDSTAGGGGGGTVINPTDLYVPYRQNAGTFADSVIRQTVEPVGNDFKLDAGKQEVSISLHNDNNGMGPKSILIGNAFPVVSPYNYQKIFLDFFNGLINIISEFISIGGESNVSNALIILQQSTGVVTLGDVNNNLNGNKIIIDDTNEYIQIGASSTMLRTERINGKTYLGDADGNMNGTSIVINDPALNIDLSTNGGNTFSKMSGGGNGHAFSNGVGKYNFQNVPEYLNNAAAITGGLVAGDIYRRPGIVGEPEAPGILAIVF